MNDLGKQLADQLKPVNELFPELQGVKVFGQRVFVQFFYARSEKKIATTLDEADAMAKNQTPTYIPRFARILIMGEGVDDAMKKHLKVGDLVSIEMNTTVNIASGRSALVHTYKDEEKYFELMRFLF